MKQTFIDKLILRIDRHFVSVLMGTAAAQREYPARTVEDHFLHHEDKQRAIAFMRVNHAGEVSAQALYLGQAATSLDQKMRALLLQAAEEERDHLAWCHRRLNELGGYRSVLDPFWFLGSFAFGAIAGMMDTRIGLGFVEETEKQVFVHLQSHLEQLSRNDQKTRKIIEQMQIDEQQHGQNAALSGAAELPDTVKKLMGLVAKVMTRTAHWI